MKNVNGDLELTNFNKEIVLVKDAKFFQISMKSDPELTIISIVCGPFKNGRKIMDETQENIIKKINKEEAIKDIQERICVKRIKGYDFIKKSTLTNENKSKTMEEPNAENKNEKKKEFYEFPKEHKQKQRTSTLLKEMVEIINNCKQSKIILANLYTNQKPIKMIKLTNTHIKGENEVIFSLDGEKINIKIDDDFKGDFSLKETEIALSCLYKLMGVLLSRGFKRII